MKISIFSYILTFLIFVVALCSVDDVRTFVNPVSITDQDITNIIARATNEVLTKAVSTDETNLYLIQAGIHAAVAITLKRARSNGELASTVKTPGYEQNNTGLIEEIKQHERDRDEYLQLYKNSVDYQNFSSPSYHYGFNHSE